MTAKVLSFLSRLLAFRAATTTVSVSPYFGLFTEHTGHFNAM
jgi:hypothetical protein